MNLEQSTGASPATSNPATRSPKPSSTHPTSHGSLSPRSSKPSTSDHRNGPAPLPSSPEMNLEQSTGASPATSNPAMTKRELRIASTVPGFLGGCRQTSSSSTTNPPNMETHAASAAILGSTMQPPSQASSPSLGFVLLDPCVEGQLAGAMIEREYGFPEHPCPSNDTLTSTSTSFNIHRQSPQILYRNARYVNRLGLACAFIGCNHSVGENLNYCSLNHQEMSQSLSLHTDAYIIVDAFFDLWGDEFPRCSSALLNQYAGIPVGLPTFEDNSIFTQVPWLWTFVKLDFLEDELRRCWCFFHKTTQPVCEWFQYHGVALRWDKKNCTTVFRDDTPLTFSRYYLNEKDYVATETVAQWRIGWSLHQFYCPSKDRCIFVLHYFPKVPEQLNQKERGKKQAAGIPKADNANQKERGKKQAAGIPKAPRRAKGHGDNATDDKEKEILPKAQTKKQTSKRIISQLEDKNNKRQKKLDEDDEIGEGEEIELRIRLWNVSEKTMTFKSYQTFEDVYTKIDAQCVSPEGNTSGFYLTSLCTGKTYMFDEFKGGRTTVAEMASDSRDYIQIFHEDGE